MAGPSTVVNADGRTFTLLAKGIDQADNSVFTESLAGYNGDLTGPFQTSIDLLALPTPKSSAGAVYQVQVKLLAIATSSPTRRNDNDSRNRNFHKNCILKHEL
jgi:hypothetical protein